VGRVREGEVRKEKNEPDEEYITNFTPSNIEIHVKL
jgi:hypothetical protein